MSSMFSKTSTSSVSTDTTALTKKATAQSQAVSDEEARRTALRGTSSTALAGTQRTTLDNVSTRGNQDVVTYKSDTSEQNAYSAERALQGVATDNATIYTLAKRQGGNPALLRGTSTEIDDTASSGDGKLSPVKQSLVRANENVTDAWKDFSYVKRVGTVDPLSYGTAKTFAGSVKKAIKKIF